MPVRIKAGKLLLSLLIVFVLFVSLFFSTVSFATTSFEVHCPQQLKIDQNLISRHDDWRMIKAEPAYYVSGLTFYAGKPEEQASLKPEISNQKNAKWLFSPNDQIFLACEYHQTIVQLTQALPANTQSCQVDYDPNARSGEGNLLPKRIVCRK